MRQSAPGDPGKARGTVSHPTYDSDGYPTDDTLEAIEQTADPAAALYYLAAAWQSFYGSVCFTLSPSEADIVDRDGGKYLRLSTGGWSGNESLIEAYRHNRIAWMMTWQLSARGGLFIFRYPDGR